MSGDQIDIFYTSKFIRSFDNLSERLKEDAVHAISSFQDPKNHQRLRVHSLKGKLRGNWSFSVNYSYRIVFEFNKSKSSAILHAIGTHAVYE